MDSTYEILHCCTDPCGDVQGTLCDTDLPEESLDCVIDKALFDSLICTDTGAVTVAQYVTEVFVIYLYSS